MKTNRAVYPFCDWAHQATCACGWNSGSLWTTLKKARRAYRAHKEDV